MNISFIVNGEKYINMNVNPIRRLVDFIRYDLNLTGTKEGCGEGECGSCSVLLDDKCVLSCLILVGQIDGKTITTIEGLKQNGEYDILQKMFIENNAVQCGYCTPGMIMAAKGLLLENKNPSIEEIKKAISGNICRCTGYVNIVKAIYKASEYSRSDNV